MLDYKGTEPPEDRLPGDDMIIGPKWLERPCRACNARTRHRAFYDATWGRILLRCSACGSEQPQ